MRAPAKSYRDLVVWQKGKRAAVLMYRITSRFPQEEKYNLTSQIRRAAVSIPSNVAEGFGRKTQPQFLRSLLIARGELFELETELEIANEVGILNDPGFRQATSCVSEVGRLLESLIDAVEAHL